MTATKLHFFNFLRNLIRLLGVDRLLKYLTQGRGYSNFFVKCIPQNYQYNPSTIRRVTRNSVIYDLDLSEYMEWVLYFGLNVELKSPLYSIIKPGMIIVDIGTNFGETLLQFARLTGEKGFVIGFEPVHTSHTKCLKNIALNPFLNICLEQMAISDCDETLYFDARSYNNSGGIYMSKTFKEKNTATIARKLDSYVNETNLNHINLIKIDVEGFETNVLKGARNLCLNHHPELYIEVDDANLKRQGSSAEELLLLIHSYGYIVKRKVISSHARDPDAHYELHLIYNS